MQRKTVQLAAVLCVLLAIGGIWLAQRERPSAPVSAPDRSASEASTEKALDEPASLEAPTEAAREERNVGETPLAAAEVLASLRVTATWPDASPAQGVNIRVLRDRFEDPAAIQHRAVLDINGSARFDGLTPGHYSIRLDRCKGADDVRVERGIENVVAIEIPDGLQVDGKVIDGADLPVAGATIQLSSSMGGYQVCEVALSDGAGRFRLRDIEPGRTLVARARDFPPSSPFLLYGAAHERVECTLQLDGDGGSLDVTVRDEQGASIEGVEVLVGEQRVVREITGAGGKKRRDAPAQFARSDVEGSCRFIGIAAGDVLVQTKSRTHAPWSGKAKIEKARTTVLPISLGPCGTIAGLVTDQESKPLSGVMITAGMNGSFAMFVAVTNAEGRYRVDGLGSGIVDVWASGGEVGRETGQVEVIAGQTAVWDVKLSNPRHLAGVVLDEDGKPLAHWLVDACPAGRVGKRLMNAVTNAEGRFRLDSIPIEAAWLVLRDNQRMDGKASLVLREFPMPAEDFVIRVPRSVLPSAYIRGLVLDPGSQPLKGCFVSIMAEESNRGDSVPVDAKGAFRVGPLAPGGYTISCKPVDAGWQYQDVELRAGQDLDLGVIEIAPEGTVRVELHSADGSPAPARARVNLRPDTRTGGDSIECTDGVGTSSKLPRGDYTLRMSENWFCEPQRVHVASGEETLVSATIEPGASRIFQWNLAPSAQISSQVLCELRDARGRIVMSAWFYSEPLKGSAPGGFIGGLALGSYTLDVIGEEGTRGTLAFSITKVGFDPTPLVVEVR